jgi:uncharacterized protein (TIGR02996 family)
MDRCGECGGQLEPDEIEDAIRWGGSFAWRVHHGDPYNTSQPMVRPPDIRLVGWYRRHTEQTVFPPRTGVPEPRDDLREGFGLVRRMFDIVHDECPDHDPQGWLARLRLAPTDDDMREVYADALESAGDVTRAELVRLVIRRRHATGDRRTVLDRQLRELRNEVPGTWCRDVVRASPDAS